MILLVANWLQIVFLMLGGGTVGILIKGAIDWMRFKKKDVSENEKVKAETAKIYAESKQIKAEAEVTVADAALKLAQRISEDCEEARKKLESVQKDLDNSLKDLDKVTAQLRGTQTELDTERGKNIKMAQEIEQLKKKLSELGKNG